MHPYSHGKESQFDVRILSKRDGIYDGKGTPQNIVTTVTRVSEGRNICNKKYMEILKRGIYYT